MKLRPPILLSSLLVFCFVGFNIIGLLLLLTGLFSIDEGSPGLGIFAILLSGTFLVLIWLTWRTFRDKIQFASINSETLNVFRPLNGKRIKVRTNRIKGYSKSIDDNSYGTAIFKRKCLTIYFKDRLPPVEFVQYQVYNVEGFEDELNRFKISFLGDEEIYRDRLGQRTKFAYE